MELVRCTLCGAGDCRILCRVRRDRYLKALDIVPPVSTKVVCSSCGHVYANPQLDVAELTRLYRDLYRSPALGYADESPNAEYLAWKKRKAEDELRHILSLLPPSSPMGSVLEIGCAEGLLLHRFALAGWQVLGVEPTPAYVAYARQVLGIEVLESLFEETQLDERHFGLVIALAVVEHLKQPKAFFTRVRDLLERGGHVLVAVPDVLDLGSFPDERLSSPHLSVFTAATLTELFRAAGLTPVQVEHSGELLVGLARKGQSPVAAYFPPPAHRVGTLQFAVWRARAKARTRARVVSAAVAVKRGVYGLFGQEIGGIVWGHFRHWTGRRRSS